MLKSPGEKPLALSIGNLAVICQIAFFYIPIAISLGASILSIKENGMVSLSLRNFLMVISPTHIQAIMYSLALALSTALISLAIAYPLGYFINFPGKRFRLLFLFFLIIPFWTNFFLHMYAWFFVLERNGFLNTILMLLGITNKPIHFLNSLFATILMMVYYYLPAMVLPITSSLERFDQSVFEASNNLGASWWTTFININIPITMPAVKMGFLLVFIPAFGEFIIPELMGGDRIYFVGSIVSRYILGEGTSGMGGAFMLISGVFMGTTAWVISIALSKLAYLPIKRIDR